ncbi:hypothetical protein LIER_08135 [Lithospermum erythrorhizon]|uniref:RNase H type-1 domain-containing protein n=1 Tax=Lithospermum erythrorhizon TaxID=34254 RepID=A0AAV3PC49_LITER
MQAPKSYKEVQCLVGCLVLLNKECAKAFEEFKAYSGSPKILTRPRGKEELKLYLAVSKGAASSVLIREKGKIQKPIYYATNNEAEYEAIVTGLLLAHNLGISRIVVKGDSKLVIEQIRGDCRVKNENLGKYHAKATTVVLGFYYVTFEHIPRSENEHADHLSRLATTYYEDIPRGVHIEHRERPIYEEVKMFPIGRDEED